MNHETRILYHFIYLLYLFKLNHSGAFYSSFFSYTFYGETRGGKTITMSLTSELEYMCAQACAHAHVCVCVCAPHPQLLSASCFMPHWGLY